MRFGNPTFHHAVLESTQDLLRELAGKGAASGTVVSADHQTRGRGRQGRVWFSLPCPQLYVSLLVDAPIPTSRKPLLSIAAGLAVAEAIEKEGFGGVGVKWPNDIYLGGKKVAGILAEAFSSKVIVGIGVNISGTAEDFPEELRERSTTLSTHSTKVPDRFHLRTSILRELETQYALLSAGRIDSLRQGFRRRSIYRDRPIRIRTAEGTFEGRATDIDEDGALLLHTGPEEAVRIVSGEIIHL